MALLTLVLCLLFALVYAAGTGDGNMIYSGSRETVAYMDTLTLNGDGDSDTLDYQLHKGRDIFCNGYITVWIYPDTGAVNLAATDSIYGMFYPGNVQGWRTNADTLLFEGQTDKAPGLDWNTDRWYQADIPMPRSEKLRLLFNHKSSDDDTVDIIVRLEWGIEQ